MIEINIKIDRTLKGYVASTYVDRLTIITDAYDTQREALERLNEIICKVLDVSNIIELYHIATVNFITYHYT
jgi:hypothetical protein